MTAGELLAQDMHVHSTFSDGAATVEENIAEAEFVGLSALTCVDHVRQDTDWVPDFARVVARLARETPLAVSCGVEAKLLDTSGALDLPPRLNGVDVIYAADHQVPLNDGPHHPAEIRAAIDTGELLAGQVIDSIVQATLNALDRPEPMVIAHLFSVLPKIGCHEDEVPLAALERLASGARRLGGSIEVDERWRCPSVRTIEPFLRHGVPLLLSTDSHRRETIGRYDYCLAVLEQLRGRGLVAA